MTNFALTRRHFRHPGDFAPSIGIRHRARRRVSLNTSSRVCSRMHSAREIRPRRAPARWIACDRANEAIAPSYAGGAEQVAVA
jgi:hypothetical protein